MVAAFLVTAVVAVVLALVVAPRTSATGPVLFGDVTVSGNGSPGRTRLEVPPVGSLDAATHQGPLAVTARVDNIDLDRLSRASGSALEVRSMRAGATDGVSSVARTWFFHTLALAAVLGLVCGLVIAAVVRPDRRWTTLALASTGLVTAALTVAASGAAAWRSFDASAFDSPKFSGALKYAPKVLNATGGSNNSLESVRDSVTAVTARLEVLARAAADGPAPEALPDDVVILHVSDLHLNPLGMQFTRQLADQLDPDAIVDSGDFTSYGLTSLEGMFASLASVNVPYYLVPGNHDSKAAVAAAAATGTVTVVDGQTVDVKGLKLTGLADPTFTPTRDVPKNELASAYRRQRPEVTELFDIGHPDVVVLHNPTQAQALSGRDVTVLSGHVHHHLFETDGHARLAVVGSTGAGGVASLSGLDPGVYQAELLRFRKTPSGYQLVTLDRIDVNEDGLLNIGPTRFTIERVDVDTPGELVYLDPVVDVPAEEGPTRTPESTTSSSLPAFDSTPSTSEPASGGVPPPGTPPQVGEGSTTTTVPSTDKESPP
jgi:3',5'-cyclic AMP phosphodiesterase CpdA